VIGGFFGGGFYLHIPLYYNATATGIDVVRDVCSNALVFNDFIYYASEEKIAKIEKENGNIVWENTLDKELTSKSSLFLDNKFVYMVNSGCVKTLKE